MRGNLISVALLSLLAAACNSTPYYKTSSDYHRDVRSAINGDRDLDSTADPDETVKRLEPANAAAAEAYNRLAANRERAAYAKGVQDTLLDFRGKMDARGTFVWSPPVMDYVDVPGQVRNGAYVPAHKEVVIVSPGRWVEQNDEPLPTRADR